MSNPKPRDGLVYALLSRLIHPLQGKIWLAAATVTFCSVLGGTTYHLWRHYGGQVLQQPRYLLNPERLVVTPQPEWIHSNVVDSAVTLGRLRHANLMDKALVLQVKQAFGVQPWVKSVRRVNKRSPSTVEVDLEYRRPVAMVEIPAGMFPQQNYEGLLPVDDEGFLLPVEFSQDEASAFPKIAGVDAMPVGPPGSTWGDPRVADAARIVMILAKVWKPLDLFQVEVPPTVGDLNDGARHFTLITRKRRRFNWQSAPGREVRGEARARDKLALLQRIVEQHGTLDDWQPTAPPDEGRVTELIPQRKRR